MNPQLNSALNYAKNNFKVFIVIILLGNKGMCLYILYIV